MPTTFPSTCVLEAIATLGNCRPDAIAAIGGGSAIDTAKAVAIALWRNIDAQDRLSELLGRPSRVNSTDGEPGPRIIAIPTTLSAAELSPVGGMLNEATSIKEVVGHEYAIPRSIIYDPRALVDTPREILLASGVKALDHAAETLCAERKCVHRSLSRASCPAPWSIATIDRERARRPGGANPFLLRRSATCVLDVRCGAGSRGVGWCQSCDRPCVGFRLWSCAWPHVMRHASSCVALEFPIQR
jgi:hypothetical protein